MEALQFKLSPPYSKLPPFHIVYKILSKKTKAKKAASEKYRKKQIKAKHQNVKGIYQINLSLLSITRNRCFK